MLLRRRLMLMATIQRRRTGRGMSWLTVKLLMCTIVGQAEQQNFLRSTFLNIWSTFNLLIMISYIWSTLEHLNIWTFKVFSKPSCRCWSAGQWPSCCSWGWGETLKWNIKICFQNIILKGPEASDNVSSTGAVPRRTTRWKKQIQLDAEDGKKSFFLITQTCLTLISVAFSATLKDDVANRKILVAKR